MPLVQKFLLLSVIVDPYSYWPKASNIICETEYTTQVNVFMQSIKELEQLYIWLPGKVFPLFYFNPYNMFWSS